MAVRGPRTIRSETAMDVFSSPAFDGHEQVDFFYDKDSGLKAIIALHDTTLGPALGGCRMWPYATEAEAVTDVLRLAKGMTYKAAMADLAYGGGKTVIIGDPRTDKSRGAVPGARPRDRHVSAAATTPARTSAPAPRTWTASPRRPATCWAARAAAAAATRRRSRRAASGSASARPSGTGCSATISRASAWRFRASATSATTWRGCSPRTAPA